MKIKPILFNTEMTQAILDGRKSCTRRLIKSQPDEEHTYPLGFVNDSTERKDIGSFGFGTNELGGSIQYMKPPYQSGDILYVRETWCKYGDLNDSDQIIDGTEKYYYRADGENPTPYNDFLVLRNGYDEHRDFPVWRPSIHMPKEAARIWLKVTDVRVERLQDITIDGIKNEGLSSRVVHSGDMEIALNEWGLLWNSTIKKSDIDCYGWSANPWVWVIKFERCEKSKGEN